MGEGGGLVLLESLVRAHETKLRLVNVRHEEALAVTEIAYLLGAATPTTQEIEGPVTQESQEATP